LFIINTLNLSLNAVVWFSTLSKQMIVFPKTLCNKLSMNIHTQFCQPFLSLSLFCCLCLTKVWCSLLWIYKQECW